MRKLYIPDNSLAQRVEEDFGLRASIDEVLRFHEHLLPKIQSREEMVTIRFEKCRIRVPAGWRKTPIMTTKPDDPNYKRHAGYVLIPLIAVAHLDDFPEGLAMLDEYNSKEEMTADLSRIYQHELGSRDVLSAYFLGDLGALDPDTRRRL